MNWSKLKVSELSAALVDAKPEHFDFGEGYAERWDYVEAVPIENTPYYALPRGEEQVQYLSEVFDSQGQRYSPEDLHFPEEVLRSYVYAEGPMMSYRYPLEDGLDLIQAAIKIAETPLCVVEDLEDDRPYLALSGGGMDLSWSICEAYIRLGYLPPSHFCGLPDFAGAKYGIRNRKIMEACKHSRLVVLRKAQQEYTFLKRSYASMLSRAKEGEA